MRICAVGIEAVKDKVNSLVGKRLKISVNKGRKRVVRYEGEITGVYPSLIMLKIFDDRVISSLTASYSDLLTGDVKLKII